MPHSRLRSFLLNSLLLPLFMASTLAAGDAAKPPLSGEIRAALDSGGVEAAKERFAEIYPARKDEYVIDMKALGEMGAEYMQAGDMQTGMAIIEMTSVISQAMVADMMNGQSGELARQLEEAQAREDEEKARNRAAEREAREEAIAKRRGPARDDLAGFTGLYGDPAEPGSRRTLWVQMSCDGYLVAGATWGDAAPWWLKSLGDREFGVDSAMQSLHLEFEPGERMRMHHDLQFMTSPLVRVDDLPADWAECLERREG